jgi:hypothetical protein
VLFYEDAAIAWVAKGTRAVKAALGSDVLCGANYSAYPFYYPHSTMYIKWFRDGAADYGRHSEYFWELGQVTPMVNGYISEQFRAGTRYLPKAIIRQYTMPHSPGNTDANFRRTAFTHIAHGCENLDFFGIGMNETFTENYIDHRDHERYRAIRDITHALALIEDVVEEAEAVPTEVALLVSESTEKWDWAGIATDFASQSFDNKNGFFRKARTTYHQERVGIYTALTFAGMSPDLVIERDLTPEILKGYKVLYLVGDFIPASVVPTLEKWVNDGGVLFATAGAGRYGMYREPNPELQKLLGIASRQIEERDTFFRTSQELPFLQPLSQVTNTANNTRFPALAIHERVTPTDGVWTLAEFEDGSPAMFKRTVGKGSVYYVAALPGVAYLYKGVTTPQVWVPDRGPGAHRAVTTYDTVAANLLQEVVAEARVLPRVRTEPGYIDTRLHRRGDVFFLSIANYNEKVDRPVTLRVRPPEGAAAPKQVISAFAGKLDAKSERGEWVITIPKLGYGDIVRIDTK